MLGSFGWREELATGDFNLQGERKEDVGSGNWLSSPSRENACEADINLLMKGVEGACACCSGL
jgi:hypothetical protein